MAFSKAFSKEHYDFALGMACFIAYSEFANIIANNVFDSEYTAGEEFISLVNGARYDIYKSVYLELSKYIPEITAEYISVIAIMITNPNPISEITLNTEKGYCFASHSYDMKGVKLGPIFECEKIGPDHGAGYFSEPVEIPDSLHLRQHFSSLYKKIPYKYYAQVYNIYNNQ